MTTRNIIGIDARAGYVRNPVTGKEVLATGRVGRQVIRDHETGLRERGQAVHRGLIGRRRGQVADAGAVLVDWAALGPPRATGAFRLQNFRRQGDAAITISDMARDIAATIATVPNTRQANIAFMDPEGYAIWRTVHGKTALELANAIDALQTRGPAHGSDEIGANYVLDTSMFQLGSVTFPAGGATNFSGISKKAGRLHQQFQLVDFSGKAANGDCLLSVLRAVALANKLPPPHERNAKLRHRLGIPAGAIEANYDNIQKLASEFGLHIRIITGIAPLAEDERVFDDCSMRPIARNRCTNGTAKPVVICEARDKHDAPPCDVYLADNHYEYIARFLHVPICGVTGDIIHVDEKRNSEYIARRVSEQGRNYYARQSRAKAEKPTTEAVGETPAVITDLVKKRRPRAKNQQSATAEAAEDARCLRDDDLASNKNKREHIIVYDYETTYSEAGDIEPYALGYMVIEDPSDGVEDFSGAVGRVTQIVRRRGENKFAVSAPLLDLIMFAPLNVNYTLVSFNGARFDHFILAQAAQARALLTGVFATPGGGLRGVNIGRHRTLDLAKLCPAMSLASACAGFKTLPKKLQGFSHTEIQKAANDGHLYDWLDSNRAALCEYLALDVLSTASLFAKVSKTLSSLSGMPVYGPKSLGTIGAHAWSMMETACPLPRPVATHATDLEIRTAIVGGRVQCYRDGKRHEIKQAHMLDFASLYPTCMAAVPKAADIFDPLERWGCYPSGALNGEPVSVDAWTPGDVGVYWVTVHSQPEGLPNILPKRGDTLDWHYRGEFEATCTHIELAMLSSGTTPGGSFTVHRGLKWPIHRQGLFEPFIRTLAQGKDEEDQLAASDDPKSNPALRMMYKLLMNSASGKCCQNNYDDEVKLATGTNAQLAAERELDPSKPITWIALGGETCLIMGKKKAGAIYKQKSAKPSILAVFIYAYSRALVWRTLGQHNVIYGDTDSGLFEQSDYDNIRKAFPQLDPTGRRKELGDLEEELKPHSHAIAYTLAPKDYSVLLFDSNGEIMADACKLRLKGVNQRNDRLIVDASDATLEAIRARSMTEHTDAYTELDTSNSEPLADINIIRKFYERRAAGESAAVYTSQITRSYKNPDKDFAIMQRFTVKLIK